ncbi:MAG: PHB depolymerase family esterase [Rudaea sp.]|nr:PHB depolymerase family esterase [Rudaea sp.]
MIARCLLLLGTLALPLLVGADASPARTGLQTGVVFSEYSPLSRSAILPQRLFSPLAASRLQAALTRSGQAAREQSIDLTQERFAVYVPDTEPAQGYALLVFVPPWEAATVPRNWTAALDRHGMIFVSAAKSGNDASVVDRREPLALLAAHNIMQRYRIDPARVYVGGFSGGSRVALRVALGYPDVFRGALLEAGSDPIGDAQIPLPPTELFKQFQQSTRLVYLTGKDDTFHLDQDAHSRRSMQEWCVFDVHAETVAWTGHESAGTAAFSRALDALGGHEQPSADKLAACRARIENEMTAQLRQVEDLSARGKTAEARKLLEKIDVRYAGLAAPRSIELAEKTGDLH